MYSFYISVHRCLRNVVTALYRVNLHRLRESASGLSENFNVSPVSVKGYFCNLFLGDDEKNKSVVGSLSTLLVAWAFGPPVNGLLITVARWIYHESTVNAIFFSRIEEHCFIILYLFCTPAYRCRRDAAACSITWIRTGCGILPGDLNK